MEFLWEYLKCADKPIVLYGMGNGADKVITAANEKGVKISGVFASKGFVRNKEFHSMKLSSFEELESKFKDMIILMCFGSSRNEVFDNVKNIMQNYEFYSVDVPVFGNTLFDKEYYYKNLERIKNTENIFSDELSKNTFKNIVDFKLSGNSELLFDVQVDKNEPYNTFLNLKSDSVYLDLGAYTGDTVLEYIEKTKSYSKIFAVEPDKKTYNKLLYNTKMFDNIICVNAAVGSENCKVDFFMGGSRGSHISQSNCEKTDCITVDKLLENSYADFIKMDIEGKEVDAIKGAENTIKCYKPKLQIACYHRSEDILEIPEKVLSIRNDYKVYMRHFPYLPAWDTNYYFV